MQVSALKNKLKKQSTATGDGVAKAFLRAQASLFGSYRDALRYKPVRQPLYSVNLQELILLQGKCEILSQSGTFQINCFKPYSKLRICWQFRRQYFLLMVNCTEKWILVQSQMYLCNFSNLFSMKFDYTKGSVYSWPYLMYWRTVEAVTFRDSVIFHYTGPDTLLCLKPEVLYFLADARYDDSNVYLYINTLTVIPLRRQVKWKPSSSHQSLRTFLSEVLVVLS